MSMGRVKEDFDKSKYSYNKDGHICKVVDVVLNPKIVQTAAETSEVFSFACQIIGNYLLEKHKIAVT
jgi:hypothetical protein